MQVNFDNFSLTSAPMSKRAAKKAIADAAAMYQAALKMARNARLNAIMRVYGWEEHPETHKPTYVGRG